MHLSAIFCLFGVDVGFIGVTGLRRGEHSSDEEKGEDGTRVGTRTMESSRKELSDYCLLYLTSFFGAVVKIEALVETWMGFRKMMVLSYLLPPCLLLGAYVPEARHPTGIPTSRPKKLKLSQHLHLEHTL